MPDLVMAASFQDIHEPGKIAFHIGMGIRNRIADPRLRGQMNDNFRTFFFKKGFQGRTIGKIRPDEAEIGSF